MHRLRLICLGLMLPATAHAGDVEQGRKLFQELGCPACHTLGGGQKVGPDLLGVLERRDAAFVRRALTDPSADVAEGYVAGLMPAYDLPAEDLEALLAALGELPTTPAQPAPMWPLALAAFLFFALHLVLSSGWIRPRLVRVLGDGAFQGLYSLLAVGTLTWAWYAWEAAPYIELWPHAPWTRWVPNLGMPFVVILGVAGYTTRSPTITGLEGSLAEGDPAQGILRVTRHPANSAFVAWGVLHLFPNGDLATVILISSVILLGVLGTWHIERRRRQRHGAAWDAYAARTSILPFVAILQGRQHLSLREIGARRIGGGLLLWLLLLATHLWVVGASPLPILP